jgi:beta-galactosidase
MGRKHETRDVADLVNDLKDMLDRGISFSLYMVCEGAIFEHWGGANSPAYLVMCSSCDYDAPINKSGNVNPKYYEV